MAQHLPMYGQSTLGQMDYSQVPEYNWKPTWDISTYMGGDSGPGMWDPKAYSPNVGNYGWGGNQPVGSEGAFGAPSQTYGARGSNLFGGQMDPMSTLFQGPGYGDDVNVTGGGWNPQNYQAESSPLTDLDWGPAFRKLFGMGPDATGGGNSISGDFGALLGGYSPDAGFPSSYLETGYTPDPITTAPDSSGGGGTGKWGGYTADEKRGVSPFLLSADPVTSSGGETVKDPWMKYFDPGQSMYEMGTGDTGVGGGYMNKLIQQQIEGGPTDLNKQAMIMSMVADSVGGMSSLQEGPVPGSTTEGNVGTFGDLLSGSSPYSGGTMGINPGRFQGKMYGDFLKRAEDAEKGGMYEPYDAAEKSLERRVIGGQDDDLEGGGDFIGEVLKGVYDPLEQYKSAIGGPSGSYGLGVESAKGLVEGVTSTEFGSRESLQELERDKMIQFGEEYASNLGLQGGTAVPTGEGHYGDRFKIWEDFIEAYNELSDEEKEDRKSIGKDIDELRREKGDVGGELNLQLTDFDARMSAIGAGETPARRKIRGFEGGGLRSGRRGRIGSEEEKKFSIERGAVELERQAAIEEQRRKQRTLDYDIRKAFREKQDVTTLARKEAEEEDVEKDMKIGEKELAFEGTGDEFAEERKITGTEGIEAQREQYSTGMGNLLGGLQMNLQDTAVAAGSPFEYFEPGGEYHKDLKGEYTAPGGGLKKKIAERRADYSGTQQENLGAGPGGMNFIESMAPTFLGRKANYGNIDDWTFRGGGWDSAKGFAGAMKGGQHLNLFGQRYNPAMVYKTNPGMYADLGWQNRAPAWGFGREDLGFDRKKPDKRGHQWWNPLPTYYKYQAMVDSGAKDWYGADYGTPKVYNP